MCVNETLRQAHVLAVCPGAGETRKGGLREIAAPARWPCAAQSAACWGATKARSVLGVHESTKAHAPRKHAGHDAMAAVRRTGGRRAVTRAAVMVGRGGGQMDVAA